MGAGSRSHSRTVLVVTAVAAVALLGFAALLSARRPTAQYAEGTPEATVQRYVQALTDGRRGDAVELLSDELQQRCDGVGSWADLPELSRVVLRERVVQGDEAIVRVALTQRWGDGLLDASESTTEETFVLARSAGGWRIVEVPWPFFSCPLKVAP